MYMSIISIYINTCVKLNLLILFMISVSFFAWKLW